MITIIDRYILRELVISFILSISFLISALLIQQLLRLSKISAETGISFTMLIRFAPYIIPLFLVLAIPLSVLISSTLTFSRLSTDHEIIALKSAGISIYRMMLPVILFSVTAFSITLFSSTILQPMASVSIKLQSYDILKNQKNLGLEEGVFNRLFDLLIYIKKIRKTGVLEGVFISDKSAKESRIITARNGSFLNDPDTESLFLKLDNGHVYFETENKATYKIASFSTYILKMESSKSIEKIRLFREVWGMSISEIRDKLINKSSERGTREYRKLLIDYHKKFSLPAAVLVLGILGVPIGIKSRFSSKFAGFILSILIVICYYIVDTGLEIIAVEGLLNPVAAAWIPVIAAFFLAIFSVIKISRG